MLGQTQLAEMITIRRNYQSTRNSAIADKPRDAFGGRSRSPNMVPFHMLGTYFSYYSLSVRYRLQKCRDLENRV